MFLLWGILRHCLRVKIKWILHDNTAFLALALSKKFCGEGQGSLRNLRILPLMPPNDPFSPVGNRLRRQMFISFKCLHIQVSQNRLITPTVTTYLSHHCHQHSHSALWKKSFEIANGYTNYKEIRKKSSHLKLHLTLTLPLCSQLTAAKRKVHIQNTVKEVNKWHLSATLQHKQQIILCI